MQGSEIEQNQAPSPLTEKIDHEFPIPRSPLAFNSSNYMSSHVLPPLKFHSSLLGPRNTVTLSLDSNEEDDDDESVASALDDSGGNYSEEDGFRYSDVESLEKPVEKCYEKEMFGSNLRTNLNQTTISRHGSTLNKGLLMENLRIEVPENYRRFTVSGGTCRLRERVRLHNAYVRFDFISIQQ